MSKNLWLTSGIGVNELEKAMPKTVVKSGFTVVNNKIEYVGNPKALKFVIPIMVAVVETLDGFNIVREPKTYIDKKDGSIKTTNVTTFSFNNEADAEVLCENVNKVCKKRYDEYLANKDNK